MQELYDMAEILFGDIEFAFESVLLEAEDKIFSEAGFSFDEFAELYELWTGVLSTFEDWLEYFDDADSVAVDYFEILEILKTVRVLKVDIQLTLVLWVFLSLQN